MTEVNRIEVARALAEFEKYLSDRVGAPINIDTARAFAKMASAVVAATYYLEEDEQYDLPF